ncbi:MAG TPA: hypothetical protein VGZ22_05060, partial [Isosphaeraceae bacterium]|nr:hypothetical protein [Isosphaeraceae bacterium]
MSHIVSLRTEVCDPVAVAAACHRLGLTEPVQGTAQLCSGEASGLLVQLPGWLYPVVCELANGLRACFTGLWVQSFEHDDALHEIACLCRQQGWTLATWDIDRGLSLAGRSADASTPPSVSDPLAAVRALRALATPEGTVLFLLRNFHRAEIVQALDSQISSGKQDRTFVVILSPVVQIPTELEKQFVVLEHELPGRDQLSFIAGSIASEPGEVPEGRAFDDVID